MLSALNTTLVANVPHLDNFCRLYKLVELLGNLQSNRHNVVVALVLQSF